METSTKLWTLLFSYLNAIADAGSFEIIKYWTRLYRRMLRDDILETEYDAWKKQENQDLYLGYNNEFGVGSVQFNNETGEEQYDSHIVYGPFTNMQELQKFADQNNIEFGIPTQLYKELENEAAYEADIIEQMRRG